MIELQDVVVSFEDRIILDRVNLTIEDGETLVVLGGSGAGKSTILRLIIGLQKPNKGKILIDGVDVVTLNENEMNQVRRSMGMVFQYSALFDSMTVGDNVAFGMREHTTMSETEIAARVSECLHLVDLNDIESLYPSELSGGMKKRVGLARAIALNPSTILYDEPTSGLDPITSGTISRLIVAMQKHLGCTSVVVTHDMQSAFYIGDRIALLEKGEFVEVSKTADFRASKNSKVQQFITGDGNISDMPHIVREGGRS